MTDVVLAALNPKLSVVSNLSEQPCPSHTKVHPGVYDFNRVSKVISDEKEIAECNNTTYQLSIDIGQVINDAELEYKIDWKIKQIGFPNQPAEYYYGCREYKRHIIDETEYPSNVNKEAARRKFINKKATQMLFRLNEGGGRAIYLIGVEDNGVANGISSDEVLATLVNFICMTDVIPGSSIRTFNIYRAINTMNTYPCKYICTIRIILNTGEEVDTTAVI